MKDNNQDSSLFVNAGRNALRYIIRALSIKEIFIPYYTCPSVWQAIRIENCEIKFYHIDKNFMPEQEFEKDSFILYTNYFGISSNNVLKLAEKYKNLIVDNSQAFYMPPFGIASFNSVRKFFPLTDGAFVFSKKTLNDNFLFDTSYLELEEHYGELSSENYDIYKNRNFDIDLDIRRASELATNKFLELDLEKERKERLEKFKILDKLLNKHNQLKFKSLSLTDKPNIFGVNAFTPDTFTPTPDVPFIYPFISNNPNLKINLDNYKFESFWGNQPENSTEGFLQHNLIPIPIDFRFTKDKLKKISISGD